MRAGRCCCFEPRHEDDNRVKNRLRVSLLELRLSVRDRDCHRRRLRSKSTSLRRGSTEAGGSLAVGSTRCFPKVRTRRGETLSVGRAMKTQRKKLGSNHVLQKDKRT